MYDASPLPKKYYEFTLNGTNIKLHEAWEKDRSVSKPVKCKLLHIFIFLPNPFWFWPGQPGPYLKGNDILTSSESTGDQQQ